MGLETPWEKPFEELLQEMSQNYKGEISRSESRDIRDGTFYFVYPTFHGELQGHKLVIEISEFPGSDISYLEAADNVEYLRIFISVPTKYSIVITHESWFDRLKKKFHLDQEFQTGEEDFDRKYYLRLESDKDKKLLKDSKFEETVKSLEPFSVLQVFKSGVRWSQVLTDKKQLTFNTVDSYLQTTLKLAKMISPK